MHRRSIPSALMLLAALFLFSFLSCKAEPSSPSPPTASPVGVKVHFQLPVDGPLPKTYRVTLAAVDPAQPSWIISTFAAGLPCTVTSENQGKFEATWDGLDDNFMPVPPGTYALKGIYMPAATWSIDGLPHTVIPKLTSIGSSWGQSPAQDALPGKIEGDPVGQPLADVDIADNGMGVAYFQYLENGTNYFLTDFNKPIGYDQIITGYPSGVFAGGNATCTDGKSIWSFSNDGGVKFIGRADGRPFGHQTGNRHNVYIPEGWVTALAAWPDQSTGHTVVFVTETAKITNPSPGDYRQSPTEQVNEVLALDGADAHSLATWKVGRPLGVAARNGNLFVLQQSGSGFEVLSLPLASGWAQAKLQVLFKVPRPMKPFDIEVDHHGRIYLSDPSANHVYQFNLQGHLLRTYGRLNAQPEGQYDPQSFMAPQKLACWTDAQGRDRLLVIENDGPNRLSEWSGDTGALIRQWVVPQTYSNSGYAIDPRHPDQVYMPGHNDILVRWKIDYLTGQWTPEAVWRGVGDLNGPDERFGGKLLEGLNIPRLIYRGNDLYLVFWRGYAIFHLEGNHWRPCSAILRERVNGADRDCLWRDLNGDGKIQPNEYLPYATDPPPGVFRYFGETFFDDLSLVCIGQGTNDIWRLSPSSFDRRGTPIYDPRGWKKVLTDPTFAAKQAGLATATRGGNEVGTSFSSDWASVVRSAKGDLYVSARSGPNFSANNGSQYKLSRYVPDGRNGYAQRWRVGRIALQNAARPGEVYGPIYVSPPINGIVCVIDNSGADVVLYTENGLYVDTLFPDGHTVPHDKMGAYWQPGEYFAGYDYLNRDNGKVYFALGKTMPEIYEAQGWRANENPVKPLTTLDKSVSINVNQIASPPEQALAVRGGAAAARVARFYPASGAAPALDGSMRGWETSNPVQFGSGENQTVEARCYYDPDHLYIRWHARLGRDFKPRPLQLPQHIFAHDRRNDTLGLYLQGDPNAQPGGSHPSGRPGDVRFVFGLFRDDDRIRPLVLGMYPTWPRPGASPQTYTTPVGSVSFANVAPVPGVIAGCQLDEDHQGFVLAASIPRSAIPGTPILNGWRTEGNFDANLGGLNRFWWSNTDGSASRETFDEPTEARLYPGSWSPVQFVSIDKLPIHSWMVIGPFGFNGVENLDLHADRDQIIKTLRRADNPPDTTRNFSATYDGPLTHTRKAQRQVSWKSLELSTGTIDVSQPLNWSGYDDEGTFYLLTHIYSPQPADVRLHLTLGDSAVLINGQLNGQALPESSDGNELNESQPLHLRSGWNELLIRRTIIWGDMRMSATLLADPAILWKLRITGPPPAP